MATKYVIGIKGTIDSLVIWENGESLPHNFIEAAAEDRAPQTSLVVQWFLAGTKGSSISLKYKNDDGEVVIVKESKITNGETGYHYSGAAFKTPREVS